MIPETIEKITNGGLPCTPCSPSSDTPETDAKRESMIHLRPDGEYRIDALAEFARKLERERDEARAEMIRWQSIAEGRGRTDDDEQLAAVTAQRDDWKEKYIQQNKDLGHELRDPNGTIWSECKRLQTELTTVTAQRDEARKRLTGIEIVMRAELGGHPDSELWGEAGLIAATMRCVYALDEVTEQRDRLAEALRYVLDDTAPYVRQWTIEKANKALQSLTPKP